MKRYTKPNEENYRFSIFVKNKLKIETHNNDLTNSYVKELSKFADLTDEEFVSTYLTLKASNP
jgi:hypothetical protein